MDVMNTLVLIAATWYVHTWYVNTCKSFDSSVICSFLVKPYSGLNTEAISITRYP